MSLVLEERISSPIMRMPAVCSGVEVSLWIGVTGRVGRGALGAGSKLRVPRCGVDEEAIVGRLAELE